MIYDCSLHYRLVVLVFRACFTVTSKITTVENNTMKNTQSRNIYVSLTLAIVFLSGCDSKTDNNAENSKTTSVEVINNQVQLENRPRINPAKLIEHVKVLSSDEFEGRLPSTPGEEKTLAYLTEQFKLMGLKPGNNGSFIQDVPLVSITANPNTHMAVQIGENSIQLKYGDQMMASTSRLVENIEIKDSPLVFVGYGIVAPEYNWDDYAGVDMKGKTAVILVNDPGFATQNNDLFNGFAMTYYGRWTYKYEEAARQGADGAIIIHQTDAAGYGWGVVSNSWSGPQFNLIQAEHNLEPVLVESWITGDSADLLFSGLKLSRKQFQDNAAKPGFKPVELQASISIKLENTIEKSISHNVVAMIPGSKRPNETILYTAHWDHLGKDPSLEGDQIYNGALDNASGTAALLEIARSFTKLPQPPQRNVVFVAVTAEEQGLLGSAFYADNPVFPLATTAAEFNIDGINYAGKTKDISIIGSGNSELEDMLKVEVDRQKRVIKPDSSPEKGYYFRSDHFNLAKKGVPAIYIKFGNDFVEGGVERGKSLSAEYRKTRYHQPADEYNDQWDMSGGAEDMDLFFFVGAELANNNQWPKWYPGNAFKAERDKTAEHRK